MLAAIKHHLSVAGCFARLAVQRQIEYPLFLVSWLLMVPAQNLVGIWLLKVIVNQFQPLNGWGYPELAFLYGLGLLSHGLQVIFFIQTWHMDWMIIRGGFDRMLLRPMGVFSQFIMQNVNFIGFFDFIPGVIIFAAGCRLVGFDWTLMNAVKVLLVVIGGTLIRASIYSIMGTFAFWTKRSGSLVGMGVSLFERTTQWPLSLYPQLVQTAFTFLIPVGFISFYPAMDFLGKDNSFTLPGGLAIWTPAVGLLMFVLSRLMFGFGLRKYESSGS